MPRLKLPDELKKHAVDYAKQRDKARVETNAANRLKTTLRNAVKKHWLAEDLPVGSYIRAAGLEFRFEATENSVIDINYIYKMVEDGEITMAQFLSMLKVDAKAAANVLGGDVVADATTTKVGNKADIRVDTLPVENADDEFVEEKSIVKDRKMVKRRSFGRKPVTAQPARDKPKRRIKTRRGK